MNGCFIAYANVTTIDAEGKESKPLRGEDLQGYMRIHFAENLRLQFSNQSALHIGTRMENCLKA